MKSSLLVLLAIIAGTAPAAAFTKSEIASLQSMSGTTRLIQACNLEALIKIAADKNGLSPEHVAIDALAAPRINGDKVTGDGGVLRSHGKWYRLSFDCRTTPDHLDVTAFDYKVGKSIPREQWADLNLYQ